MSFLSTLSRLLDLSSSALPQRRGLDSGWINPQTLTAIASSIPKEFIEVVTICDIAKLNTGDFVFCNQEELERKYLSIQLEFADIFELNPQFYVAEEDGYYYGLSLVPDSFGRYNVFQIEYACRVPVCVNIASSFSSFVVLRLLLLFAENGSSDEFSDLISSEISLAGKPAESDWLQRFKYAKACFEGEY